MIDLTLGECTIINDSIVMAEDMPSFIHYLSKDSITKNHIYKIQYLANNQNEETIATAREVQRGDIVYSMSRPYRCNYGILKDIPDNFFVSTDFAVIRGIDGTAITGFIYYFLTQGGILKHWDNIWHKVGSPFTSIYPATNVKDISQIPIELPPIDEQRRIAHILGTLDDRIQLNHHMRKTLEEMIQTLFHLWFVNFDPIHAKSEGRPSGFPTELDVLFPSSFEESEIGLIPKDWRVKNFGEVVTLTSNPRSRYPPPRYYDGTPVVDSVEMRRVYSESLHEALMRVTVPEHIVEDGDLLVSWCNDSLELILWPYGQGAFNYHLFKVTSDKFPLWFYRDWLTEHLDCFRKIDADRVSKIGHIEQHQMTNIKIAVPPLSTVLEADHCLSALADQEINATIQTRSLAILRDNLALELIQS